jgi:hypothetical protein
MPHGEIIGILTDVGTEAKKESRKTKGHGYEKESTPSQAMSCL